MIAQHQLDPERTNISLALTINAYDEMEHRPNRHISSGMEAASPGVFSEWIHKHESFDFKKKPISTAMLAFNREEAHRKALAQSSGAHGCAKKKKPRRDLIPPATGNTPAEDAAIAMHDPLPGAQPAASAALVKAMNAAATANLAASRNASGNGA